MAWIDTIRLGSYHSLIVAHSIESMEIGKLIEKHNPTMRIESFGLFDTAAPNFSTYYPGVSAEDFKPKDDEFIEPVYRALSETIVHRNWNPVDFSKNGALKKSMGLLRGQTIYPNHENMVGNELGAVSAVAWEESYIKDTIKIPAGINAKMKIDGKSNPKIVRAIQMDPPAVHSTSVTVEFLWEKSHASLTEEEFFRKLGSFDKDGEMYRRIVTAINRYNELSLVSKGADPFAQKVTKEGINNPKEAGIRDQQKSNTKMSQKVFFFDFQTDLLKNSELPDEKIVTIPDQTNNTEITQQNENTMNKQFLLALAAVMGLTGDQYSEANITEDAIKGAVTSLAQQNAIITKLREITGLSFKIEKPEDVAQLQDIITKYNGIKDKDITSLEAFHTSVLTALRNDVTTLYQKVSDGKVADAIISMIANSNREVLVGLQAQYQAQLEEKFPMKCGSCGSTTVSRASAKKEETSNGVETPAAGSETKKESLQEIVRRKQQEASIPMGAERYAKKA